MRFRFTLKTGRTFDASVHAATVLVMPAPGFHCMRSRPVIGSSPPGFFATAYTRHANKSSKASGGLAVAQFAFNQFTFMS